MDASTLIPNLLCRERRYFARPFDAPYSVDPEEQSWTWPEWQFHSQCPSDNQRRHREPCQSHCGRKIHSLLPAEHVHLSIKLVLDTSFRRVMSRLFLTKMAFHHGGQNTTATTNMGKVFMATVSINTSTTRLPLTVTSNSIHSISYSLWTKMGLFLLIHSTMLARATNSSNGDACNGKPSA